MKCIIDTNVPLKASNINVSDKLDARCSYACLRFIQSIMNSNNTIIVLDSAGEILKEYNTNFQSNGQDTVATIFLKWIHRNLTLREKSQVEQQYLTVTGDREYTEFPKSPSLNGFDRSDRKFIAVANAHPEHPQIVEGSDSLWWRFKDALEELGIHIYFLCEDYVKTKYEETYYD